MQLESLKLYCDVVRLHSFSRAADANYVSQSAASQAIQQIEDHLTVKLIDRTKRPFVVTPEGQTFYTACRQLLDGWEKAKADLGAVKAKVDGTVRVAAIYSTGLHDLSRHQQRFMSLYPEARVELELLHPHKVVEAVVADEADVGIMSYPPANRALTVVPLRQEPMAFVCHPSHPLARRRIVPPAQLNGEPFVAFDRELEIRRAIDRALRQHNVKVDIRMEFDNIETIKRAVEIDAGVALLPEPTVGREVSAGTLASVRLTGEELVRPLGIIHARGKPLAPTVERFVELLRGHAHDLDAAPVSGAVAHA